MSTKPKITKAKTAAEIRTMLSDSIKNLRECEARAIQARTLLRPEIKAYKDGAIWALEWVLGKRG